MPIWLIVLLAALAVFRVARMIAEEDGPGNIFLDFRNAHTNDLSAFDKGIRCPLCVGFWVALVVSLYLSVIGVVPWSLWPLAWPGIAGLAVKIHEFWRSR